MTESAALRAPVWATLIPACAEQREQLSMQSDSRVTADTPTRTPASQTDRLFLHAAAKKKASDIPLAPEKKKQRRWSERERLHRDLETRPPARPPARHPRVVELGMAFCC